MFRIRSLQSGAAALAYWSGMAGAGRREAEVARIVNYHGTPRTRAGELERQLRYLRRQFNVVPLAHLLRRLDGPPGSLRRLVAITFDDGLRNNVTVVYPILARLGIPATFFVCPGLIDAGKWLWNCEARQRLRHAGKGLRRELAKQYGVPDEPESFVRWMKTLDTGVRRGVETVLRAATRDYAPSAEDRHALDLAGWDELRSLDPSLIELGSHTMHHPILSCIGADEVETELRDSRRVLEERLQRPIELFAYPNGDHSPLVRDIASRHYRAALVCGDRFADSTVDRYAVPRFGAPQGALRLALLANALHAPGASAVQSPSSLVEQPHKALGA